MPEKKKGSFRKEFSAFINKGNVVDMAVGVIIGGAFGSIVSSLVNDVIMPVVGLLTGGINYSEWFVALDGNIYATLADATEAGAATLKYGQFIGYIVNFIIIALCVFMMVKLINKFKKKEPPKAPTTKKCPYCLSDIPIKAVKCAHCASDLPEEE